MVKRTPRERGTKGVNFQSQKSTREAYPRGQLCAGGGGSPSPPGLRPNDLALKTVGQRTVLDNSKENLSKRIYFPF